MTLKKDWTLQAAHIASVFSIIACFWFFFKYIKQMNKGVKSLLIVILAISDLVLGIDKILHDYWEEYSMINLSRFMNSSSICFSIFWVSAIAFIIYQNLIDRYIDLKKLFIKVLLVVLILAPIRNILLEWLVNISDLWIFGALMISLLLTIIFYRKSFNILQEQSRYEKKSTSLYIRNLRYFSFVQLFIYCPLAILPFIAGYLGDLKKLIIDGSETLVCLSGFLTVLMFACQGGLNPEDESEADNDADLNLTSDILMN